MLGGYPLYGLNDHFFGVLIGPASGLVQDVLHFLGRHGFGVTNDLFFELFFGRFHRHAGGVSEHFCRLGLRLFKFLLLGFAGAQSRFERFFIPVESLAAVFDLLLVALQVALLILEFVFEALDFSIARLDLFAVLFFELQKLLFGLKDFLFLDVFAFLLGFFDDARSFAL